MNKQKRRKEEKGITLVALIITIIVLLILAVVAIRAVQEDGIITKAKDAKTETEQSQYEEEQRLLEYEYKIAKSQGTFAGTYNAYVLKQKYGLNIGDKVNYNERTGNVTTPDITKGIGTSYSSSTLSTEECENENLEWRILGINDVGQIELISTNPTNQKLYIYGKEGYLNAETKNGQLGTLDSFCQELYGQGEGAESARSLNVEDVNKLINTGYNPTTYSEYGMEYTYKYDTSTSTVKSIKSSEITDDMSKWIDTGKSTYSTPEWIINSDTDKQGPQKIKFTCYKYKIADEITTKIENNTKALSDIILKGEENFTNVTQWLASTFVMRMSNIWAVYGVCYVDTVGVNYSLGPASFLTKNDKEIANGFRVRPVVTLNSNAKLVDENGDGILEIVMNNN